MLPDDIAIRATELSKDYHIFENPQDRLKQMIMRGRRQYYKKFCALDRVSMDIKKGSSAGIIGRNGAGKSTLLQLIAKTLTPSHGTIEVNGRVAALLELGTGFNPEFSGKENVFLNASILGLTQQEIEDRYDKIVGFADIGDFLDRPVKTYSSGMFVRLAFGVAINVDPDILIVDEALSVGDIKFQAKCFRRFEKFREEGRTILFVSHSPEQVVRQCDHAFLIDGGRLILEGSPRTVTNKYLDIMFGVEPALEHDTSLEPEPLEVTDEPLVTFERPEANLVPFETSAFMRQKIEEFHLQSVPGDNLPLRPGFNASEFRWGDKSAEIIDYMLCSNDRCHINHFYSNELISLFVKVRLKKDVAKPIYGLTIKTHDGVTVYGTNSRDWDGKLSFVPQKSGDIRTVCFSFIPRLITNHYILSLGVAEQVNIEWEEEIIPLDRRYDCIEIYVRNNNVNYGIADLELKFSALGADNQVDSKLVA